MNSDPIKIGAEEVKMIEELKDENLIRKVIGEGIPSHLIKVIMEVLLKQI